MIEKDSTRNKAAYECTINSLNVNVFMRYLLELIALQEWRELIIQNKQNTRMSLSGI